VIGFTSRCLYYEQKLYYHQTRKPTQQKGSRIIRPPGLQIYLLPRVTLTLIFDLLTPTVDRFINLPCRSPLPSCSAIGLFVFFSQNIVFTSLVTRDRTDGRTDGRTNGQTDKRTDEKKTLCLRQSRLTKT